MHAHSKTPDQMQADVEAFNRRHPVGSALQVYPQHLGGPVDEVTVAEPGAHVFGGHTAVVQVAGGSRAHGCIALTHVRGPGGAGGRVMPRELLREIKDSDGQLVARVFVGTDLAPTVPELIIEFGVPLHRTTVRTTSPTVARDLFFAIGRGMVHLEAAADLALSRHNPPSTDA